MPATGLRLMATMVLVAAIAGAACRSGPPVDQPVAGTETLTLEIGGMT